MINSEDISKIARKIGRAINAERVILFGSWARGEAGINSDVDLLIIADSEMPRYKRSRDLYKMFRPYPFGMDLLIYTPQEIERGKKSKLSFISAVFREGKTLYVRRNQDRKTVAGKGKE